MSDMVNSCREHIHYAIWFGLIFVALLLLIAFKVENPAAYVLARLTQNRASMLQLPASMVTACGAYLLFRLVRPFPFVGEGVEPPASRLYYFGNLLITFATALIASFLAWSAIFINVMSHYSIAGLVLPLMLVAGFLCVEAAGFREGKGTTWTPPYVDPGILSALILVPGLLAWFMRMAPRGSVAQIVQQAYRTGNGILPLALAIAVGVLLLWWMTRPLRRQWQKRSLYRAAVISLWCYGVVAILNYAFLSKWRRVLAPDVGSDWVERVYAFMVTKPLAMFGIATVAWLILTVVLYANIKASEEQ